MTQTYLKRNFNLDLIRCVAVLFVLSVHFFLNNGFYGEIMQGKKMYVASIMRQLFVMCVPLFLILTGYLMNKKQLVASYFKGIYKVLISYVLCTICICLYRMLYLKETLSILDIIFNITSYQQYSWYIEMYIGLYLLIPFLNILYHGLQGKRQKEMLIVVLIILVTLPSVFNTVETTTIPVADTQILPEWWNGIYPLLYYYIGAYLSEYNADIKMSLRNNVISIILSVVLCGTYSYWRSYGETFIWGAWCSYGGFSNVICATLVFLFLLRIDISFLPNCIKKILVKISEVSLLIYLLSWIFDNYAYSILNASVESVHTRLLYFGVIVPFVFVGAFVLACIVEKGVKILESIIKGEIKNEKV